MFQMLACGWYFHLLLDIKSIEYAPNYHISPLQYRFSYGWIMGSHTCCYKITRTKTKKEEKKKSGFSYKNVPSKWKSGFTPKSRKITQFLKACVCVWVLVCVFFFFVCVWSYYLATHYYRHKEQMKWKASARFHHLSGKVSCWWLWVSACPPECLSVIPCRGTLPTGFTFIK